MTVSEAMRGAAKPMSPIPTGFGEKLPRLTGIRAVIFDVYGTLIISETGDISGGGGEGDLAPTDELKSLFDSLEITGSPAELAVAFAEAVRNEHRKMSSREPYPEIVAERLWSTILGIGEADALVFAAAWEASVNRAWEMPGASAVLRELRSRGFALGILSNAQAYTPPLFPLLLGDSIEGFGFDPALTVFSWREGRAKPSPHFFGTLVTALKGRGISPESAVFVGNDMLKDMAGARAAGLRTCLFAGDTRSLKTRIGDSRCAFEPDAVITALDRIPALVGAVGA